MSSDDNYLAFLNKANEDLNAGRVAPQQTSNAVRTQSVDVDVTVPAPLRAIDTYYVSETDEPFEPVVLKWEGASRGVWPGPSQFSYLISPSKDLTDSITTLSPSAFDPKNQYVAVLRAVRAAATQASGGGEKVIDEAAVDVKVYRVEIGPSRVEYWIVALDVEGGKLVGLKAKAIES
ncbi:hypothetical protein DTO271G3_2020 [Paecilomyces variotii]|nr:hypothetical protein DTO271G3_2020 [Paecilomyces variotii]